MEVLDKLDIAWDKPLVKNPLKIVYGKQYLVLHYPNAKIEVVNALDAMQACHICDWEYDQCFVHYLCDEVTYADKIK